MASGSGGQTGWPALAHQVCGTTLEAQWFCPTCGEVVDADHASDLHWV